MHIYVLKCEQNKYYIGKTNQTVSERFKEHKWGDGCEWTRKYKPLKILVNIIGDDFDEDKYTKMYMKKYGIDNVRGGSYTSIYINKDIRSYLENEIIGSSNKCYKCHKTGHFVKECDELDDNELDDNDIQIFIEKLINESRCFECGRKGHYKNKCYAKTYDTSLTDIEIEILENLDELDI